MQLFTNCLLIRCFIKMKFPIQNHATSTSSNFISSSAHSVMSSMWLQLGIVCPLEQPRILYKTNNIPLSNAIHSNSHQITLNSCWNIHMFQNAIRSFTILNQPTNLFYYPSTVLVSISDCPYLSLLLIPLLARSQSPAMFTHSVTATALFSKSCLSADS